VERAEGGAGDDPGRAAALREEAESVHEEVDRLPGRDRDVVVLCDFEGLTREEAAARLGCPAGTVGARLFRARNRLRERLTRRGLAPSAAPWFLNTDGPRAAVPDRVEVLTARAARLFRTGRGAAAVRVPEAASSLAKGVLHAMFLHSLRSAALLLVAAGAFGLGAAALVRHGQADEPPKAAPAAGEPKPGPSSDREAIAALEKRIAELERKVEALIGAAQTGAPARPPRANPGVLKVRARFGAVVERVHVQLGQKVKKGDPLVELYSADLAKAKTDFQTRYVQWQHDLYLYNLRKKLVETGAISQQLWVDTQNDEQKSRLDYTIARDNLLVFYEVPQAEIDPLLEGLGKKVVDDRAFGTAHEKARMTLRSKVDGVVLDREVGLGDLIDPKTVLMEIDTARP
jgi:hypothetical protein